MLWVFAMHWDRKFQLHGFHVDEADAVGAFIGHPQPFAIGRAIKRFRRLTQLNALLDFALDRVNHPQLRRVLFGDKQFLTAFAQSQSTWLPAGVDG